MSITACFAWHLESNFKLSEKKKKWGHAGSYNGFVINTLVGWSVTAGPCLDNISSLSVPHRWSKADEDEEFLGQTMTANTQT